MEKMFSSLDQERYNNYFTRKPMESINTNNFRGRGLTKIRELLMDFQEDDDFIVSKAPETEMD